MDELLVLNSIELDLKDGLIPEHIQLIPPGVVVTPKGSFVHDEISGNMVINEFNSRINDTVVDYEHYSLVENPTTPIPAAGWLLSGSAVYNSYGTWSNVKWTDRARQYISAKEYRYVSPVIVVNKEDNRVIKLVNLALTNTPNIDGMIPLINSINFKKNKGGKMKEILSALNLAETTDDITVILNRIKELKELKQDNIDRNFLNMICKEIGLSPESDEKVIINKISQIKTNSDLSIEQMHKVAALTRELAEIKATELVNFAMEQGKIAPAQKAWALDYAISNPEQFRVFINTSPTTVPLGRVDSGGKINGIIDGRFVLTESQKMVNKLLGISDEQFIKHIKGE